MAKPAAARSPKVYAADLDGVHEWIVAAPNQRAALDALGVHQDLFAQGRASVERDPVKVEAARDQPGVPLRRARGSTEDFEPAGTADSAWSAALRAAPGPAARAAAKPRVKSAKTRAPVTPAPKPAPKARPAGPSAAARKAARDAEAALRAFEREAVKATSALDAERIDLDNRERKVRADLTRRRAALERAVERTRVGSG